MADAERGDALEEAFEAATQFVGAASTSKSLSPTDSQLLRFYGLYKQATAGTCTVPKPSLFDRRGRAKWNAWQLCNGLSSIQAQQKYVDLLTELSPGWAGAPGNSAAGGGGKRVGVGGPVQSRMADAEEEEEEELDDAVPPLLQAARAGDAATTEQLLQQGMDANQRGAEGETALHWAADRGHLDVLRLLLSHGADMSATDCDGLAPLHYAALAEQEAAAQLLAAAPGAQLNLRSTEGEIAADVAPDSWRFLRQAAKQAA